MGIEKKKTYGKNKITCRRGGEESVIKRRRERRSVEEDEEEKRTRARNSLKKCKEDVGKKIIKRVKGEDTARRRGVVARQK